MKIILSATALSPSAAYPEERQISLRGSGESVVFEYEHFEGNFRVKLSDLQRAISALKEG